MNWVYLEEALVESRLVRKQKIEWRATVFKNSFKLNGCKWVKQVATVKHGRDSGNGLGIFYKGVVSYRKQRG